MTACMVGGLTGMVMLLLLRETRRVAAARPSLPDEHGARLPLLCKDNLYAVRLSFLDLSRVRERPSWTAECTLAGPSHPDSPGRWEAAKKLADAGEPTAILPLVSAYLAAKAGDPRWDGPALRGRGHHELATW